MNVNKSARTNCRTLVSFGGMVLSRACGRHPANHKTLLAKVLPQIYFLSPGPDTAPPTGFNQIRSGKNIFSSKASL